MQDCEVLANHRFVYLMALGQSESIDLNYFRLRHVFYTQIYYRNYSNFPEFEFLPCFNELYIIKHVIFKQIAAGIFVSSRSF